VLPLSLSLLAMLLIYLARAQLSKVLPLGPINNSEFKMDFELTSLGRFLVAQQELLRDLLLSFKVLVLV
jgi:hypothetical protein